MSFTVVVYFHYERSAKFFLKSERINEGSQVFSTNVVENFKLINSSGHEIVIQTEKCCAKSPNLLMMNSIFGAKNGFSEGQSVILSKIDSLQPLEKVQLSPESVNDWDIFESNSELLETTLLSQIPVVCSGIIYPVWAGNMCLFAKCDIFGSNISYGCLTEGTEVHVVPVFSAKTSEIPSEIEETPLKKPLKTRNNFVTLPKFPFLKSFVKLRNFARNRILGFDQRFDILPPEIAQPNLAFCLMKDICVGEENARFCDKSFLVQIESDSHESSTLELYLLTKDSPSKFIRLYETLLHHKNHILLPERLEVAHFSWVNVCPFEKTPENSNFSQLKVTMKEEAAGLNPELSTIRDFIQTYIDCTSTGEIPMFISGEENVTLTSPIGPLKLIPMPSKSLKLMPFSEIQIEIVTSLELESKTENNPISNELLTNSELKLRAYKKVIDSAMDYIIFCVECNKMLQPAHLLFVGSEGSLVNEAAMQILIQLDEQMWIYSQRIQCTFLKGKKVETILKLVSTTIENCISKKPSMILLEDLDCLCHDLSESNPEMNSYLNKLANSLKHIFIENVDVFVMATVTNALKLHPELRKTTGSRVFTKIIKLPNLIEVQRQQTLEDLVKVSPEISCEIGVLNTVSRATEGFTVQDLYRLTEQATMNCINRAENCDMIKVDWDSALKSVQPIRLHSAHLSSEIGGTKRGWGNVGGMIDVKKQLQKIFIWPAKYPELYAKVGIRMSQGALLYGPSGCGKTLVAAVLANETNMNFISVKGPELMSKYIGASEEAVRDLFARAESAKPCLIFFDEFDSLAPRRGHDSSGVTDRVVNQLLTQLDGVETLQGVFVLAACSRPDLIDPALLRPGRIDNSIYCGLPNKSDRLSIVRALSDDVNFDSDVCFADIGDVTIGRSGADMKAILTDAHINAVHRWEDRGDEGAELRISNDDLVRAIESLPPMKNVDSSLLNTSFYGDDLGSGKLSMA